VGLKATSRGVLFDVKSCTSITVGSTNIGSAWTARNVAVKRSELKEVNCIFDRIHGDEEHLGPGKGVAIVI
jgi:hypothetical protein